MKTLDEMIAVMEASKTKPIEQSRLTLMENPLGGPPIFGKGEWVLTPHPNWDWTYFDYRVKQEAKEARRLWVNWKENQPPATAYGAMAYFSESDAKKFGHESIHGCLEFIELTPEIREKLGIA